jgi:hypothetical protein
MKGGIRVMNSMLCSAESAMGFFSAQLRRLCASAVFTPLVVHTFEAIYSVQHHEI